VSRSRRGKRQYLTDSLTRDMMRELDEFLISRFEIPAMRHGNSQTIETLTSEETLLLAKFIRNESRMWIPRIASL
jgi:hypothetical protein